MALRITNTRKSVPTYAIVGDGYSEKIYFEQLREAEQLKNIHIKPDLPNRSGKGAPFMRVMDKAVELYEEGYEKVYCIIDVDTIVQQQKLDYYLIQKNRLEKKGIIILECNPCFEMWYLLHFKKTAKLFSNCDAVAVDIKRDTELKDYSKEQNYYHRKNLYKVLRPKLKNAIENALFLEKNREEVSPYFPRAEVFKIFKDLSIIENLK